MTTEPVYFLLVDDLEENLLALDALLRRDGLVLLRAQSGAAALELLLRHEVALALVDVQMPGMDGFELAELMRGTERTRRVPIIFLTAGAADRGRRFRGYEAGAVDFLQKPVEADVLRGKAGVFFDLGRQRQEVARLLAESRRYAEALKDADRRKDEFLATLAHELRNPLAPLRTGLQVLCGGPDGETAARTRAMMGRQLGHMVRLIDDLLDVSRISSGKLVLKRERVEVRAVVDGAVEANRQLVQAAGHELTLDLPDDPLEVHADPVRAGQVVSNLLNNAAKYTPDGGRIVVSARRDGAEAVVTVSDTGTGIAADMLPRVFELFTQVGRTLDRSQGGLGIGLSLVKKLVELHGGAITAESEGIGRGSTFTVRLPLAEAGSPAASPSAVPAVPAAPEPAPRGLRVLVVDDNVDGAESLALLLEMSGHLTRVAHDGAAALATAREFDPAVVFLDIGLPGMNGYEVAGRLRREPGGEHAVLVALTGWGGEEDKRRSKEAGFDHHLTKPVAAEELAELLGGVEAARGRRP